MPFARWMRVWLRTLVVATCLLTVTTAGAQQRAVEPTNPHPHAGLGGGLSLGRASQRGRPDAWIGRLDYEAMPALAEPGRVGGLFGFAIALQGWSGGGDWGVGLPFEIMLGVRAPGVRATMGVGFEAVFVDRVADDTGVGLYAPLAGASVAVEVYGWRVGVDTRVTRRWQIGADDHTQWQAGISIGRTWERRLREPYR